MENLFRLEDETNLALLRSVISVKIFVETLKIRGIQISDAVWCNIRFNRIPNNEVFYPGCIAVH